MFIPLQHKSLHVYNAIRELTKEVYRISKFLPGEEKYNMIAQMRSAALSVKLNLAEGSTRRSLHERNRFIEISRGSVVEIDAILETAVDLKYLDLDSLQSIGELLNKTFAMLTKMIQ